ncbi:MAG TPA: hypothetical protein VFV83_01880 [Chthoniobacteraceae bacterium]|nr:hypothetical protein [Chthoniobacteraceae bacterium]
MKAFLSRKVAAFCAAALITQIADPTPADAQVRLGPRSLSGSGLAISLTTNGIKFVVPSPAAADAPAPRTGGISISPRTSFAACVTLSNRSNSDIEFTFPSPAAAATHFTFRILNTDDDVIWESDGGVISPTVMTDATLGKRRTWRRTIQVPLKTDATTWLPAGHYTLQAFVSGTPGASANVFFDVVHPPPPPPPPEDNQGIEGVVLQRAPFSLQPVAIAFPPIPVKANYTIEEIVPPNMDRPSHVWNGVTDDQGRFHVVTPPGLFKVTASKVPQPGDPTNPPPVTTIEARVSAGIFTKVTLILPGNGFPPPPPADTGIKGLVLASPGGPVAEQPLANAPVTVDEITDVVVGRPRFHWSGKTDENGQFEVATYPGRYRVTAAQFNSFKATADVTVTEHAFTEVKLIIENPLVRPVAAE